jgi:hypothetical protein
MKEVIVEITGKTPLLMSADNVDWADRIKQWQAKPANKRISVAGDDRSPAFTWIGRLYNDGERVTMPSDNLMSCLMGGGALVPVPGGRRGKTFKSQSQSGLLIPEYHWPIYVDGKTISMADINVLKEVESFQDHEAMVKDLGFELFVKRAKIGNSKHVRVRPRFDKWAISGTIMIIDSQITTELLLSILEVAGNQKGLGDWRPGAKAPGSFGMFESKLIAKK